MTREGRDRLITRGKPRQEETRSMMRRKGCKGSKAKQNQDHSPNKALLNQASQTISLQRATRSFKKLHLKPETDLLNLQKVHLSKEKLHHSKEKEPHPRARIDQSPKRWTQIPPTQRTRAQRRNHKESPKKNQNPSHRVNKCLKCKLFYILQRN